jgi:hypothetical protein
MKIKGTGMDISYQQLWRSLRQLRTTAQREGCQLREEMEGRIDAFDFFRSAWPCLVTFQARYSMDCSLGPLWFGIARRNKLKFFAIKLSHRSLLGWRWRTSIELRWHCHRASR